LAGKLLVVGYDEDGESCSINHGYIDELRMTTKFMPEDFGGVEPTFEFISWS
jgi:hypothetical protein